LSLMQQIVPDLILMDAVMPGMDGSRRRAVSGRILQPPTCL